jgi:hypothetical protein
MVNSKKMSKSSVAVIVLAILLALSMVLGLTGAWFTAKSATEGTEGDSITIRNGWLSFVVEGGKGSISSTGDMDNAMPGDKITVADANFSVKVAREGDYTGDVQAHVFLLDESGAEIDYVLVTIAEGEEEADVAFTKLDNVLDLTDANSILVDNGDGTYTVNTGLTFADAGKTASFEGIGAYKIAAVQVENVSKTEAYDIAKAL